MKVVTIKLAMNQRGAALCGGNEHDAHRGTWEYDPDAVGCEVAVGDVVVFECLGDLLEVGVVTDLVAVTSLPKWCSGTNSRAFTWRAAREEEIPEMAIYPRL